VCLGEIDAGISLPHLSQRQRDKHKRYPTIICLFRREVRRFIQSTCDAFFNDGSHRQRATDVLTRPRSPDVPAVASMRGPILTAFDALRALPAEWRAKIAGHEIAPVTSGESGAHVFQILDPAAGVRYLKIATGAGADHLRREVERTQWLASVGIRVPKVLRRFDSTAAFAVTMTALDGRSAACAGAENWRPVVRAIAHAFAAIHALPVNSCPFDETLSVRLARAYDLVQKDEIDASQFGARNAGVTPEDLYERLKAGVPAQEDRVVTHGDATLSNLIFADDGKIGFVDCGNCGRSDRYVDLAPLVSELADRFGAEARNIFLQAYGELEWDDRKAEFYRDLYELF
jgi:aminoglycoside 3'-phosphotransferase II